MSLKTKDKNATPLCPCLRKDIFSFVGVILLFNICGYLISTLVGLFVWALPCEIPLLPAFVAGYVFLPRIERYIVDVSRLERYRTNVLLVRLTKVRC